MFQIHKDKYGKSTKFFHLVAVDKDTHIYPSCEVSNRRESKDRSNISLTHIINGHQRFIIEVKFKKYIC